MKFLFFVAVITATVLISGMVELALNNVTVLPQNTDTVQNERLDDLSVRVEELEKFIRKLQADAVQESMRRDALDRLGDVRDQQLQEAQGKINEQLIAELSQLMGNVNAVQYRPAPPQTIDVNVNQSMLQQQPWVAPWNNRGLLFPLTY